MVLPSATFSSNYSKKIEEFVLENFTSNAQIAFSEGVSYKVVLLICKKEKSAVREYQFCYYFYKFF